MLKRWVQIKEKLLRNLNILALFVSAIALVSSISFGYQQQKHNENSVRPLCQVLYYNRTDAINVAIINKGTGPLIVKSISCTDGNKAYEHLCDFLFDYTDVVTRFVTASDKLILASDVADTVTLIHVKSNNQEVLSKAKQALKDVVITVTYCDIYGNVFVCKDDLSLFK